VFFMSSVRKHAERQVAWLSLNVAIFKFGIADEQDPTASRENAWEELTLAEVSADNGPASLNDLAKILREITGAQYAEINRDNCTFSFSFCSPDNGASWIGGSPWAILDPPDMAPNLDPRLEADALFNKVGLVLSSDEDTAQHAKTGRAVRFATGLVWHQYMLRAFDRAILANRVILSARIGAASAPFANIPVDVWPILTVIDWQNGIASDPQGDLYYSLRAASARQPSMAPSIAADENKAAKALAMQLKSNPKMKRAEAASWCRAIGYKLSDRGFQYGSGRKRERMQGWNQQLRPAASQNRFAKIDADNTRRSHLLSC
jgi:hypothetical protein